jgi:hypothetical protein
VTGQHDSIRHCRCGTRLARDNPGRLCSSCVRAGRFDGTGSAPLVPAEFWLSGPVRDALAAKDMGRLIRAYRLHPWHGRPVRQAELARWAGHGQSWISRTESGPRLTDLTDLTHWARVLRIPPRLLWFQLEGPEPGAAGGAEEVRATIRRSFVALGGAAVAGQALGSQALGGLQRELDLLHMSLDRGTASPARAAALDELADDLGVQAARLDPQEVLATALAALRTIRGLLEQRQPTREQAVLVAASAKLATVTGEILQLAGQFPAARQWYQAAGHAAGDAGDRYLSDMILGGLAQLLTYSEDPRGVLSLLAPRLGGTPPAPTPAAAYLWGMAARAHASLGEAAGFGHAIDQARDCLERSSPGLLKPGIFSFRAAKLAFYETAGAVSLNDSQRALDASGRALALYAENADPGATTDPALTRLQQATALAASGEPGEGCQVAISAITDPVTCQSASVRLYARRFGDQVRAIQSPDTRQWREVHAQAHGRVTAARG